MQVQILHILGVSRQVQSTNLLLQLESTLQWITRKANISYLFMLKISNPPALKAM